MKKVKRTNLKKVEKVKEKKKGKETLRSEDLRVRQRQLGGAHVKFFFFFFFLELN